MAKSYSDEPLLNSLIYPGPLVLFPTLAKILVAYLRVGVQGREEGGFL